MFSFLFPFISQKLMHGSDFEKVIGLHMDILEACGNNGAISYKCSKMYIQFDFCVCVSRLASFVKWNELWRKLSE